MDVPSGRVMISTADDGRIWRYSVVASGLKSNRGVYMNAGGGSLTFFVGEGEVLMTSTLLSEDSHRRDKKNEFTVPRDDSRAKPDGFVGRASPRVAKAGRLCDERRRAAC